MKRLPRIEGRVAGALPIIAALLAACASADDGEEPVGASVPANPPGPQPDFGPLVKAQDPPPPISGGTLAVTPDGNVVVAADSDRDRINVVDLATRSVRHSIELPHRSEPGRVTIDDANRAHVALRGSNEIATVDLATGAVSRRSAGCVAPRGIAWDRVNEHVLVACASGQLVTFAPEGGGPITRIEVGRDVRDVLVQPSGKRVKLTRFRAAQLMNLDLTATNPRPSVQPQLAGANVAWRAVLVPSAQAPAGSEEQDVQDEQAAIVAQEPTPEPVSTEPGGYGGSSSQAFTSDCATPLGIVSTRVELEGAPAVRLPSAVLPVDLATNGRELVVVAAGNAFTKELPQIYVLFVEALRRGTGSASFAESTPAGCASAVQGNVPGQAIAAAFTGPTKDSLVVQTREPAAIHIMTEDRRRSWKTIPLPGGSRVDTGHVIFHANAGGFLACASCHAEGADDGHTWTFANMGPRRTPSLLGTIKGTEPFHWDGDMSNLRTLVDNVFTQRMSGPQVDDQHLDALGGWMFALPPPAKMQVETDAVVRGKKIFDARCTGCHDGPMLTNNKTVDVGTGKALQVPSLVGVAWRAPYIHTGCAQTLFDRFEPECGGANHGDTRDLLQSDIRDLVAFLETL